MTDELKQLAVEAVDKLNAELRGLEFSELTDGQRDRMARETKLEAFREVQRQTVEAACRLLCPYCEYGMPAYPLNGVKTSNGKPFWHQDPFGLNLYLECKAAPIRALLSPAKEVCPKCGSIKRGVRREVTECIDEHGMQDIFPCNHKWHGGACGD